METAKRSYIVFECIGDPSKDLMGTAVAESIKKAYPEREIVVVTQAPEVWLHNPNIYRIYRAGMLTYFYDDYMKDADTLVFRHDPYTTTEFAYSRKHLIDIWCELCGVPRAGSMPSLHFTWREKEAAGKLTASPKPIFLIQATASLDTSLPYLWQRDIPIPVAEYIVDRMHARGYQTVQVGANHHPQLRNVASLPLDFRQTLCAVMYTEKRLLVDSYALQAATAHNLPSVAAYVTGSPKVSGYDMHKNVSAFGHLNSKGRVAFEPLINYMESYKDGYDLTGAMRNCPYLLDGLFDPDEILEKLK